LHTITKKYFEMSNKNCVAIHKTW